MSFKCYHDWINGGGRGAIATPFKFVCPEFTQIWFFYKAYFLFNLSSNHWLSKSSLLNRLMIQYDDRLEEEACRTISLCTGMQSSTLAGLLATQFLGSSQAVPPACSVVAMAIMGLCLASFWGNGYRIRDLPLLVIPKAGSALNAQWSSIWEHKFLKLYTYRGVDSVSILSRIRAHIPKEGSGDQEVACLCSWLAGDEILKIGGFPESCINWMFTYIGCV